MTRGRRARPAAALVLAAFPFAVSGSEAEGGERRETPSPEARVEVFVHDGGEAVRGAAASALEVFVDDEKAAFDHDPDEAVSVLAVLDLSASVRGPRLRAATAGVSALFSALGPDDRCALASFSRSVELHANWEDGCARAAEQAAALKSGGPSALNNALTLALGLLADAPGRPVLALFTDGVDGASWSRDAWPLLAAAGSAPLVFSVTAPPAVGAGGVGGVYGSVNREDLANAIAFEGRNVVDRGRDLRGLRNTDPFWVLGELARVSGGALLRTGGEPEEIEASLATVPDRIRRRLSLRLPAAAFAPGPHRVRVESPAGEVRHTASFTLPDRGN